jgi:hypothetical protein
MAAYLHLVEELVGADQMAQPIKFLDPLTSSQLRHLLYQTRDAETAFNTRTHYAFDPTSYRQLQFTVNVHGNHWIFLVFDTSTLALTVMDSLNRAPDVRTEEDSKYNTIHSIRLVLLARYRLKCNAFANYIAEFTSNGSTV